MKHIKNFFYNINDLILAVIILAAAAVLIYWRLDIILDYPEKMLESSNNDTIIEEIQVPEETPDETEEEPTETEKEAETEEENEPVEEEPAVETGSIFIDGKLSEDVTVKIQGGSANAAVNSLISANFFDDYNQYSDAVKSFGGTPENIKAGTYSFRKDTTLERILDVITF
ncbi:MAG TPA: hypothetical protein VJ916_05180 [Anaerovoracaceae bacterium]|nr:hypothetical protein [Anaerovoracaceae bacterium]